MFMRSLPAIAQGRPPSIAAMWWWAELGAPGHLLSFANGSFAACTSVSFTGYGHLSAWERDADCCHARIALASTCSHKRVAAAKGNEWKKHRKS